MNEHLAAIQHYWGAAMYYTAAAVLALMWFVAVPFPDHRE